MRVHSLMFGLLLTAMAGFCQTNEQSLGDVARAAREARKPTPPSRVITNEDLRESPPLCKPAQATESEISLPTDGQSTSDSDAKAISEFEIWGKVFRQEASLQKAKIADIQQHLQDLKDQFEQWKSEYYTYEPYFNPDGFPLPVPRISAKGVPCLTTLRDSPKYAEWCHTPETIEAKTKAAQKDLEREQAQLERLQDKIRRKGYGAKIYDPD